MATYATTTLAQAVADVSARLADPTNVRWSVAELTGYLQGALRTWNSLTAFYRDSVVLTTTSGVPFYDAAAITPTVCGSTITDANLVAAIQVRLLEPVSPTVWTGSDQFTLADVVNALQRRRDQFLLETGRVITRETPVITPTMGGLIDLDPSIVTVRRAAWTNSSGTLPLCREDVWNFDHYAPGWVQSAGRSPIVPFGYSVGETPPLAMQIVPPPSDRGVLDLLVVARGAVLNPSTPVLLGIPDDFAWVVLFGALSDLLSKDGLASDPDRAAYCQSRWAQGIVAAKAQGFVLSARINDVALVPSSVTECDKFNPLWQGVTGVPTDVLLTGGTLIGLSPVPNGVYSVTLDVVRNAPVPILPTDFLQVGPELLDILYDYTEHSALFKEGMPSLQANQVLMDRFYQAAGVNVSLAQAQTPNRSSLLGHRQRDEQQTPRVTVPVGAGVA